MDRGHCEGDRGFRGRRTSTSGSTSSTLAILASKSIDAALFPPSTFHMWPRETPARSASCRREAALRRLLTDPLAYASAQLFRLKTRLRAAPTLGSPTGQPPLGLVPGHHRVGIRSVLEQPPPQLGALLIGDRRVDALIEERILLCLLGHGHLTSMPQRGGGRREYWGDAQACLAASLLSSTAA